MFLTLTLPSYGKVIPGTGLPRDPARYDYRSAALDALLFPRMRPRHEPRPPGVIRHRTQLLQPRRPIPERIPRPRAVLDQVHL